MSYNWIKTLELLVIQNYNKSKFSPFQTIGFISRLKYPNFNTTRLLYIYILYIQNLMIKINYLFIIQIHRYVNEVFVLFIVFSIKF